MADFPKPAIYVPGFVQGAIILLVCLCVCQCVCNIRRFTDCESCTRPISTNPGSVEAGEYGLTRGACCVARSLELVAVSGLLCTLWCFLGGAGFFSLFLFHLRTQTAYCTYEAASCLIYLSTRTDCESCTWPISPNPRSMYRGLYRVPLFY